MKLLLKRDVRSGGKPSYTLECRVELSGEEKESVERFRLLPFVLCEQYGAKPHARTPLPGYESRGRGDPLDVVVTLKDCLAGHTIQCTDVLEISALADCMKAGLERLKRTLEIAEAYHGEELVEL